MGSKRRTRHPILRALGVPKEPKKDARLLKIEISPQIRLPVDRLQDLGVSVCI